MSQRIADERHAPQHDVRTDNSAHQSDEDSSQQRPLHEGVVDERIEQRVDEAHWPHATQSGRHVPVMPEPTSTTGTSHPEQ